MVNKIFENFLKTRKYMYIYFLACMISFSLFTYVNDVVFQILPNVNIKISSLDKNTGKNVNHITILENESTEKFYKLNEVYKENQQKNNNVENLKYIKKGEYGYLLNAIHFNEGSNTVDIKLKKIPSSKIIFYNIGISKKILIESKRERQILNLSEENEGGFIHYFPFKESRQYFVYSIFAYILLSFLIFMAINIILGIFKNFKYSNFWLNYNPKTMLLLCYSIIMIYVSFKFFTNTFPKAMFQMNGELVGDQIYYWRMGTLLKNAKFNELTRAILSFRGYTTFVLPGIAQLIGEKLKINELWLFFLMNNYFILFLLTNILPKLHNILSNKKVKNYQVLLLFFIFSIFWKGVYYSVTVDILAVTFLLYSLLLFLQYLKKSKTTTAFFSGVCIGISSLTRGNYRLGIYIIFLLFILNNTFLLLKKLKIKKIKNSFFIYFLLGIILICIPQIKLNYSNGKKEIFPYDKKGSWSKKDETLTEEIINITLTDGFTGHPLHISDVTAQKIKRNFIGDMTTRVSLKQSFSVFIANPIDTIVFMQKKLFLGLNTKNSEVYPDISYKSHSNFYIFSLLNYFIISTSFYFVLNKRVRNFLFSNKEKLIGSILFVTYIIPQLIIHVEWRYFILLYLIIYYIFAFKLYDYLHQTKFNKSEYLKVISISILILFLINSFYYDVF